MTQFFDFGNGSDGILTISSSTIYAPIDSSCSGSSGSTSLSATNTSFSAGQRILIIQSRGTGVGNWEVNQISSYVAGTITTVHQLANTYTDSGASQAQVLVLKQYSSGVITATLTGKAWNTNIGGIIAFLINGKLTISGSGQIALNGANGTDTDDNQEPGNQGGFRGGVSVETSQTAAGQGEGTSGDRDTYSTSANGSGGGGGGSNSGGGGGGGNGTVGSNGSGTGGTGGSASGSADLTTMTFGGAGGGGRDGADQGSGANGGGIVLIFAKEIDTSGASGTATNVNGGDGGAGPTGGGAGCGGGAGGSVFIKSVVATLGTNKITATGGSAGSGDGFNGGAGGSGRIRIESCSRTGVTNPSASESIGGHSFCGSLASII